MKNKGIWLVIILIIVAGIAITMSTNIFVKNQRLSESSATEAAMAKEIQPDTEALEAGKTGAGVPMAALEEAVEAESSVVDEVEPQPRMAAAPVQNDAPTEAKTLTQVETVQSPLETEGTLAAPLPIAENSDGKTTGAKTSLIISGPDYRTRLDELGVQIQKIREEGTESTTYSLKAAAENELKLWDSELNSIYNDLLNYMSDEEALKLIEEEREWMKARDAAAVEAAKKSAGGTLEGLEYTASLAESTKKRAYELADMYVEKTK